MFWRYLLVLCAALDLLGGLALVGLVDQLKGNVLLQQGGWVAFFLLTYLLLGWLFGSYTVLRWPWLRLRLVVLRLGLAALGSLVLLVAADWLLNVPVTLALTHRSNLLLLLGLLTAWALLVRLVLRGLVRSLFAQRWRLVAHPSESPQILREWQRTPFATPPRLISGSSLPSTPRRPVRNRRSWQLAPTSGVVLGTDVDLAPDQQRRLQALEDQGVPITSVIELAESQLERLPPALLPDDWLDISSIPWANSFSVQRQLKRMADVVVALLLLLISLPVWLLAALLIWLEDRGPVFYVQQRSGLMGEPFTLLKMRTMSCADPDAPARWTVPGDCRITRMGRILRPTRLDELPQLLNVLSGDMSLIGPRPERPELEQELEAKIPHYRKRHWMRPGLSGWAQVCAPYAASVEEAELKLSYDLYYLRHWSTWLDLLILFKTIKTVLKAGGR